MDAPRPGKPSHRLASRFVVRTPVLPLDTLAALADPDLGVVRAALRRLLDDPGVREAMFVASPELATQVEAWHQAAGDEDPAIERTILRYVSRMAGRATPFGLFSGVAVGAFAPQTALTLGARAAHGRHTRLDNDYLFKLCDQLLADAAVRRELRFVPNSSLYRVGDRWRYANGRIGEAGRSYFLVAVESTPYLEELLTRAAAGATLGELGDVLAADPDLTRAEIDEFLDELVAAQVVVPTLQPRVTGPEPGHVMIELLGALPSARHVATTLADVTRRIAAIDEARGAPSAAYRELGAALGALPVEVDLARLFQVDLHLTAPPMTLGPRVAAELTRGFELLRKLSPPPNKTNDAWTKFREAFSARYETREVPLVEALDEESGIGFASAPSDTAQAPLIADLAFPNQAGVGQVPWAGRNARLLTLLANALARGAAEVELSDKDVEALSSPPGPLADTFTIGATVIAASAAAVDAGDFQLRVDHFGNASAARLYGRFCHGNDEITALVGELTALEQQANPDVIFAEIVHLPEGRIGNILLRPVLRGYEIPYLGTSGADADHQVAITDLMVSVVGDRVVLRSRRLGKEIRPELATAHNYSARSLVIYRFLCAHATQHTTGGTWSWGPALEDAPFLPRVRHGKLILERARWLLRRVDLEPLEQAAKGAKAAKTPAQLAELRAREIAAAHALRARRGLPRWVVVADGDNELPVDFDNPLSVEGFANLLKGRPMAILHELLPGPDELAVHGPEGGHVHELMAAFVRDAPAPVASRTVAAPSTIARRFAPGSTWLYAKLYGGTSSCEAALREVVAPLVTEVFGAGLAEQFFFIRYTDPEHHLRLRFRGEPQRLLGEVLPRLAARLEPAMARGLVWRFQLDTYEREVERYGGDHGIELSEALFAADSEAVLAIVEATPGDDGAAARWRLAARGLDTLLGDLGMTIPERLALMTSVRDSFGAEVGMEVTFQRRLGDKFRAHRAELAALLAAPADDAEHPLSPGLIALARRSERLVPIVTALRGAALTTSWAGLASSYAHMHVNRMLANAQRRQELVLYDLLRRHYDGVLARQKANARRQ